MGTKSDTSGKIGKNEEGNDLPQTVISHEYGPAWKLGD